MCIGRGLGGRPGVGVQRRDCRERTPALTVQFSLNLQEGERLRFQGKLVF